MRVHVGQSLLPRVLVVWLIALGIAVTLAGWVGTSSAFAGSAWWQVSSSVRPSTLAPGGEGTLTVKAVNIGDGATAGQVTISDALPPGVSVLENEGVPRVRFVAFGFSAGQLDMGPGSFIGQIFGLCQVAAGNVACTTPKAELGILPPIAPYEDLEIQIAVKVEGALSGSENVGKVTGGEAATTSTRRRLLVSEEPVSFGVEDFSIVPEEEGGGVDAQAGSHPFQLTTTFSLNQTADPAKPPALARNLQFKLPAGLVGNTTALPQCSDLDFRHILNGSSANLCSSDTAVGVASLTVDEPLTLGLTTLPVPLFNLVPGPGEPARFGFEFSGTPVTLDTSVRTGSDYGVTVSVGNITELTSFLSSTVTFWGVPGDPVHDQSRGWDCLVGGHWATKPCVAAAQSEPAPFLTLPTSCSLPFNASVEGESWPTKSSPGSEALSIGLAPVPYSLKDKFGRSVQMTGCNQLPFAPSIEVQPDVQAASTPTGLAVHVRVPQEVSKNPQGLSSSSVKDTTVTLPQGMTLNPAGANGLEACSESEIGFQGKSSEGTDLFSASLPSPFCPTASKIGTVKFKVPIIEHPLEGAVYLAEQNANPFGSLIAMYIIAEDQVSGVLVKLAGEVQLSDSGQVVTTLHNAPQAPLEEAEFHFFGGDRAPLSTPSRCGRYETKASFTPWSGNPPAEASSSFEITSGPNGGACPNPLPFAPTLAAGSTNIQAGAFTPFTTTISREDGNQDIQSVRLRMPPGFSGMISNVTPCSEQQANSGTCGPESLIGHTIVSVGLGGDPYSVTGGQVFITGPYKGAPFGLSIVNPAKAGPFDLGKVIVRAKLDIDPKTAQATITTDTAGPYAIPHILDGIPLQIKHVNVVIDRERFAFNPTNCDSLSITGNIGSTEGADAPVMVPFQITNCATLKFAPKFTVTTNGRTSKKDGASLTAKVVYPAAAQGTQANIAKVKVALPKQLPSRLSTLQKACLAGVFEANPANCPSGSIIGHATVHTPLLPDPLTGPAYFVSHGGEAFPSLTLILQGDNVTIELVGNTLIRNGITSTTFSATPDAPFNSFELTLPQGPGSALAANGNLCKAKLTMPTEFTAQNGLRLNRNTKITTKNCSKPHKRKTKRHRRKH